MPNNTFSDISEKHQPDVNQLVQLHGPWKHGKIIRNKLVGGAAAPISNPVSVLSWQHAVCLYTFISYPRTDTRTVAQWRITCHSALLNKSGIGLYGC